jgi:hypothetical protein
MRGYPKPPAAEDIRGGRAPAFTFAKRTKAARRAKSLKPKNDMDVIFGKAKIRMDADFCPRKG